MLSGVSSRVDCCVAVLSARRSCLGVMFLFLSCPRWVFRVPAGSTTTTVDIHVPLLPLCWCVTALLSALPYWRVFLFVLVVLRLCAVCSRVASSFCCVFRGGMVLCSLACVVCLVALCLTGWPGPVCGASVGRAGHCRRLFVGMAQHRERNKERKLPPFHVVPVRSCLSLGYCLSPVFFAVFSALRKTLCLLALWGPLTCSQFLSVLSRRRLSLGAPVPTNVFSFVWCFSAPQQFVNG